MGGLAGIGQALGQTGSDIARGILEAREAKRQRATQATEMQMRTAKRAVGQPIMGADGKWRQIIENPMTGQRMVEEVTGLPPPPDEFKGFHVDQNTGEGSEVWVPAIGGRARLVPVLSAATPEKTIALAYETLKGIGNKEVQATARRAVDSDVALGKFNDAYATAKKSILDYQQSLLITGRTGMRVEAERKVREEEFPGLVAAGNLTENDKALYIAAGKYAFPRTWQVVGTEMQTRVNEISGMLETVPVPVYRTTTGGIAVPGGVAAPKLKGGGGAGIARPAPSPPPNRQVRYPEAIHAELERLDKIVQRADAEIEELLSSPLKHPLTGLPDVAATNARVRELGQTIINARVARRDATSDYTKIQASKIDLFQPLHIQRTEVTAVGRSVDLGHFAPEDREGLRMLPVSTPADPVTFKDKRTSAEWEKVAENVYRRVR